nr:Chain A, Inactive dihydroorotase-like domain [Thermochaetoides thermophila]5NNL_B Chain B, Inactive dihydroorotase-like domain [Thermochaetoides thermophila]
HRTIQLPGLINIAAFVPGLVTRDSEDLQRVTQASIAAGYSMIRIMPVSKDGSISDVKSLKVAQQNSKRGVYCDFNLSITATSDNANQISSVAGEVGSLFIPFNHLSDNISKVTQVEAHFDAWPKHKPIITDARTTDLASILLLASLHNRRIHVSAVTTKDDIKLITLGKQKGLKVTCDVCVYSLFLSQKDCPGCHFLPTPEDQEALWEHLPIIDVFSIGSLPYQLAHFLKKEADVTVGIADALPLLLTAVVDGRLTVDYVKTRLHDNPKEIFELHDQVGATVEIELDRAFAVPTEGVWSPFAGKVLKGVVQRVTFQDQVACLDGVFQPIPPKGADMSTYGAL